MRSHKVVLWVLPALMLASCGTTLAAMPTTTATRAAPTTSTSSTTTTVALVDQGLLSQTEEKPTDSGRVFDTNAQLLWNAIVSGDPQVAHPFFFPLTAYIQIKAISDPVHDYDTRLIYRYDMDLLSYHRQLVQLGGTPHLRGLSVPESSAEWISPGVEYNKGSYWRVYGSRLYYSVGGATHFFPIYSLISWRGQWYVVHVGPPTS
ncbi:MAG: hypothetical protein M0Z39_04520 [Actinomycetota bacterium]|nr:hypothetical protein [Actinomycetota bacterium]